MLISHKHKFIFVHIQKTGGSSVEAALLQMDPSATIDLDLPDNSKPPLKGRHYFAKDVKEYVGDKIWDEYFTFAFVRNPWSRLVSWYSMIDNSRGHTGYVNEFWRYVWDNAPNFDVFLKRCTDLIEEDEAGPKSILFDQLDYLTDDSGKVIVDYVGHFENINDDFKAICDRIGLPAVQLPHANKSQHKHYSAYYSKKTMELVSKRHAKDIEHFEYSFVGKALKSDEKLSEKIARLIPYRIRSLWNTFVGVIKYHLLPKKTVVLLLSPMRSGSTLLKALLAQAPDVSHLPEIDYQRMMKNKYLFYAKVCRLSSKPIIVLKRPRWFEDSTEWWRIPNLDNVKLVLLVRDAHGVVNSLANVPKEVREKDVDNKVYLDYWCDTYECLLKNAKRMGKEPARVKYEELTKDPKRVTRELFDFIGSEQKEGVSEYSAPKDFDWRWGIDDGGKVIKTLKVQEREGAPVNQEIKQLVEGLSRAQDLRKKFGYI